MKTVRKHPGRPLGSRSRRRLLHEGLSVCGGISVSQMLSVAGAPASDGLPSRDTKAVILLWLSGGPSHIDMWDPKPLRHNSHLWDVLACQPKELCMPIKESRSKCLNCLITLMRAMQLFLWAFASVDFIQYGR